jgi:hypothetical protein
MDIREGVIGLELEWLFAKALNLLMMILENLSYEQGPCTLKSYDTCRLLTWQSSLHTLCDVTTCLIAACCLFLIFRLSLMKNFYFFSPFLMWIWLELDPSTNITYLTCELYLGKWDNFPHG